jgi:hypothetical protein
MASANHCTVLAEPGMSTVVEKAAQRGRELTADESLVAVAEAADAALPIVARKLGAHMIPPGC